MRRVDEAHALAAAEIDDLPVLQDTRGAVGEVVERDQAAGLPMCGGGLRRNAEPRNNGCTSMCIEKSWPGPTP
jgi:hypothetical protein